MTDTKLTAQRDPVGGAWEIVDGNGRPIAFGLSKRHAKLFAAAPEMLTALKHIKSLTGGQFANYARAAHNIAATIIAKAQG